jgi:hypothetical protein
MAESVSIGKITVERVGVRLTLSNEEAAKLLAILDYIADDTDDEFVEMLKELITAQGIAQDVNLRIYGGLTVESPVDYADQARKLNAPLGCL